jgi:hypothetical protein
MYGTTNIKCKTTVTQVWIQSVLYQVDETVISQWLRLESYNSNFLVNLIIVFTPMDLEAMIYKYSFHKCLLNKINGPKITD